MRLAPSTDNVPASVNRYLLPHERQVISVHQHPAVLIKPVFFGLVALALAGFLSYAVHRDPDVILGVWILFALVLIWVIGKIVDWAVNYFVVTSSRMLLAQGILMRKVNMMPLTKVTDMTFQRSPMGQLLGYGEFIVESAGQDQALSHVTYLPYPEQLYLEVCGLIFKDPEEPHADPGF
jgi:membrane protein YdbS with pleckstrin-like domain